MKSYIRVATLIFLIIALSFAIFALRAVRKRMIASTRMQQMSLARFELRSYFCGVRPTLLEDNEYLNRLGDVVKYPAIPLLIYEGRFAFNKPEENSWRSNIATDLDGHSFSHMNEGYATFEKWNHPRNICQPVSYYCWDQSRKGDDKVDTNVMTLCGKGTITDLLMNGAYSEDDESIDDLICLIEVANSGIHWGCKGDLDIDKLPDSITSGIDRIGVTVMFRDEQIWYIDKKVPLDLLKLFMSADDCRKVDREEALSPYKLDCY